MNNNTPTLYIDMDGVVADFNGFAATVLQIKVEQGAQKWSVEQWAKLRDYPCLYRYLPKTSRADDVMTLAQMFRSVLGWNIYMLTAVPKGNDVPDAFHDKILWMQKYYPSVKVRFGPFAVNKKDHCKPGDVLIDDRISTCEEWRLAGGRAILATDLDRAVEELKIMFESERLKNT
jgi:5'(3')-deoxyribonucleotidase